jgi:hypothetical protein
MKYSFPERNRRVLLIDDNRAIHDDFRKIPGGNGAESPALARASNVYTADGVLIVKAGTRVSPMLLERLRNFARLQGLGEPFGVET